MQQNLQQDQAALRICEECGKPISEEVGCACPLAEVGDEIALTSLDPSGWAEELRRDLEKRLNHD